MPFTHAPREMTERQRVTRKCVFDSVVVVPEVIPEGGGEEEARGATVREAVVPL